MLKAAVSICKRDITSRLIWGAFLSPWAWDTLLQWHQEKWGAHLTNWCRKQSPDPCKQGSCYSKLPTRMSHPCLRIPTCPGRHQHRQTEWEERPSHGRCRDMQGLFFPVDLKLFFSTQSRDPGAPGGRRAPRVIQVQMGIRPENICFAGPGNPFLYQETVAPPE